MKFVIEKKTGRSYVFDGLFQSHPGRLRLAEVGQSGCHLFFEAWSLLMTPIPLCKHTAPSLSLAINPKDTNPKNNKLMKTKTKLIRSTLDKYFEKYLTKTKGRSDLDSKKSKELSHNDNYY